MAKWRLTLDNPVTYGLEPAYTRSVHCGDFAVTNVAPSNTYRDPSTGIVMLKPSPMDAVNPNFRGLDQWTHNADAWEAAHRPLDWASGMAEMLTTVKQALQDKTLIEILALTGVIATLAFIEEASRGDSLKWALQSTFTLYSDQSFAITYHGISDELVRLENWFAVQWDDIGLHFSGRGVLTVNKFRRNTDGSINYLAYDIQDTFEFADPGQLVEAWGHMMFIPIPGIGLLFTHSYDGPKKSSTVTNSGAHVTKSFIIPWATKIDSNAHEYLFSDSLVNIALNPYQPHMIGYEDVTFAAAGTFTDAPFDPGYYPSNPPSDVRPLFINSAFQTGTAVLNKADNSAQWQVGDQQGRVEIDLTTPNVAYTPFVRGYSVEFPPWTQTRQATPFQPRLRRLEFQTDGIGHFEGTARCVMQTYTERLMVERADATWLLEYSFDQGATWLYAGTGIATTASAVLMWDNTGCWYDAEITLEDNTARLREIHDMLPTAFDGMLATDAVNKVLGAAGEGSLLYSPPELADYTLPLAQNNATSVWKLAPKVGDDGEKIVDNIMLFLRRQNLEYFLLWQSFYNGWMIEKKPRDDTPAGRWSATPYTNSRDISAKTIRYSRLEIRPEKAEANMFSAIAVVGQSPKQTILTSPPLVNMGSLTNPLSQDYLGRHVALQVQCEGVADQDELNKMARRMEIATMHNRMRGTLDSPDFIQGLYPSTMLDIYADGNILYTVWIKNIRVVVETDEQEQVSYDFDSVWESDMP